MLGSGKKMQIESNTDRKEDYEEEVKKGVSISKLWVA